jgi:hypothetical protein
MSKAPTVTAQRSRRQRGFEPASGLLRERIRTVGESRGFAMSRLLTHWAEVVGDDVARQCRPIKVTYKHGGFGATLSVLTTGSSAPMLQMQLPQIRDKVNACYGYNAIARIALTQTAPLGFSEGQAQFTHAPKVTRPENPAIAKAASEVSAGVADSGLRDALEVLARNVLSRSDRLKGI